LKYSISSGTFVYSNNAFLDGCQIGIELKDLSANFKIGDFLNEGIGMNTIADVTLNFLHVILQYAVMSPFISWLDVERLLSQLTYDYLIPINSENDINTIRSKALLAHVKYLLGKYDDSINLMNEIISLCKKLDYPYENYLHDLAYYQYDSGDKASAYENFKIGYNFIKNYILFGYRWMTVEEKENLTRAYRGNLDNIPHYAAITPEDSRYAELGYNALLFTKGLLLNSSIELFRLLQEEGDTAVLNLLTQWRKKSQEYQVAQQKGDYIKAKSIKGQIEILERQLIEKSRAYGDYTDGLTVDYKDVQDNLQEGDIAIEFFFYQYDAKSRMYGAIILTKNNKPKYIPIGLDSEWGKFKDNCYSNESLFNLLFANLKQYLPNKTSGKIYFAADGLLHTIAIENLPGSENFNFRRLSSTREIALHRNESKQVSDIAIFGGVKYGIGKLAEYYNEDSNGNRESLDVLSYLPGTKIEAERIEKIFSRKMNVYKFVADKATESAFKDLSGKRIGLLHLATHGFFNKPLNIKNPSEQEAEAMKLSGLYLAGAQNTLWDEPESNMKEDGILSAQEISTLDLRGLRLAVLSACETGNGAIGSDGVFGLQRGFKQAGADGLMMSLWKVDDMATQMLMEEFYKNISSGSDQYSALINAQNEVRKIYPNPKYWAAFILIDAIGELKL
jgi:CHAT domain-containing protein